VTYVCDVAGVCDYALSYYTLSVLSHQPRTALRNNSVGIDLMVVHVRAKVVILRIDVLGPWPILVHSCNFDCSTVVFEYLAMNRRNLVFEPIAFFFPHLV
jgi:hypothetical protein